MKRDYTDDQYRSMKPGRLELVIEGATPSEIERGTAAAQQVFDRVGVTPFQAARARFLRDVWDRGGFQEKDEPSERSAEAAHAYDEAEAAAWEVVRGGPLMRACLHVIHLPDARVSSAGVV